MSEQTPRGSEANDQHRYEQLVHREQGLNASTEDLDVVAEKHHAPGNDAARRHGFFKRKSSAFYHKLIKPAFPEAITDIKIMSGMTALEARVKHDISNEKLFPEITRVAKVRRGDDLCLEEQTFLVKRKLRTRDSFAKYLGLDPQEVEPEDVPVVAFGGSGGGFRAMIGCLSYCAEMKRAGLWDCLTFVSGVSGSCWSLALYYTIGQGSMQAAIDHCKDRLYPYHPLSGHAIRTLLSAPGGARVTLGPVIQKSLSGLQTVAMDLYSVFTTGWIFFQDDSSLHADAHSNKHVAGLQKSWETLSSMRKYTDDGSEPLPIMTAIRHERPWKDWADKEHPFRGADHAMGHHSDAPEAWFQWFEFTPYEVGCDELAAWVPTWGFGRPFSGGRSTKQMPEQSLALLLGLATSAPAGPLTSYITTIDRNLPSGFLGHSVHRMAHGFTKIWGKGGTEEFQNHHPLHACNEHNFLYHFTPKAPNEARPPGIENSPRIHLIDSGMDNNCPTYVVLNPQRRVDVIINMDASSDVQKNTFPDRVAQIGSRRGMRFTKRHDTIPSCDEKDPDRFHDLYAQVYDGMPCARPDTVVDSYGRTVFNPPAPMCGRECTMVYLPLLPNERAVPDFDPSTAKFSGSYNLVWTAEQIEMLVKVCRANFEAGQGTIKDALREAWLRNKDRRGGGDVRHRAWNVS